MGVLNESGKTIFVWNESTRALCKSIKHYFRHENKVSENKLLVSTLSIYWHVRGLFSGKGHMYTHWPAALTSSVLGHKFFLCVLEHWETPRPTTNCHWTLFLHYNDVIMSAIAFQIISLTIVYSDQRKLRVTGLCAGNSPVTGEFPAQRTSNAENVSIWWRHHATLNMSNKR